MNLNPVVETLKDASKSHRFQISVRDQDDGYGLLDNDREIFLLCVRLTLLVSAFDLDLAHRLLRLHLRDPTEPGGVPLASLRTGVAYPVPRVCKGRVPPLVSLRGAFFATLYWPPLSCRTRTGYRTVRSNLLSKQRWRLLRPKRSQ